MRTASESPKRVSLGYLITGYLFFDVRGRGRAFAGGHDVDPEVGLRSIVHVGRQISFFVPDDADPGGLGLARDEVVAGTDLEFIAFEVAEHAEAVALIEHHHAQRMRARLNRAVVDVELGHLRQPATVVGFGEDLYPVQRV